VQGLASAVNVPYKQAIAAPLPTQVLDDGREHRHRYSLSVSAGVVEEVAAHMAAGAAAGLRINVVVSGASSHRYVDCVPEKAGKEQALQVSGLCHKPVPGLDGLVRRAGISKM
jgi:hypothetical protein